MITHHLMVSNYHYRRNSKTDQQFGTNLIARLIKELQGMVEKAATKYSSDAPQELLPDLTAAKRDADEIALSTTNRPKFILARFSELIVDSIKRVPAFKLTLFLTRKLSSQVTISGLSSRCFIRNLQM